MDVSNFDKLKFALSAYNDAIPTEFTSRHEGEDDDAGSYVESPRVCRRPST